MVTFLATRAIHGDYGLVHAGSTFTVHDAVAKRLQKLEANGTIIRQLAKPRVDRSAYRVHEKKVIDPPANKQSETPTLAMRKKARR